MILDFDVASLQEEHLTGVGLATRHLFFALKKVDPSMRINPVLKSSRWKKRANAESHLQEKVSLYFPWSPWTRTRPSVYHGPDFKVPAAGKFAKIATIHDLVEFHPAFNSPDFIERARANMHALIEKSKPDLLLAVSEFTRKEIELYFPSMKDRVRVVHHGADHLVKNPELSTLNPHPEQLIVCVGTLERRKNQATLIDAFLKSNLPAQGYKLLLIGKKGFAAEEILAKISDPSVEISGYLSQEELASVYRRAAAFALPSLYEGFGFPILEAMSFGTPVLTSHEGACAEVAGDAALLVDPHSAAAIAAGLERLVSDQELRFTLQARAPKRLQEFTWEKCAKHTIACYREAQEISRAR